MGLAGVEADPLALGRRRDPHLGLQVEVDLHLGRMTLGGRVGVEQFQVPALHEPLDFVLGQWREIRHWILLCRVRWVAQALSAPAMVRVPLTWLAITRSMRNGPSWARD